MKLQQHASTIHFSLLYTLGGSNINFDVYYCNSAMHTHTHTHTHTHRSPPSSLNCSNDRKHHQHLRCCQLAVPRRVCGLLQHPVQTEQCWVDLSWWCKRHHSHGLLNLCPHHRPPPQHCVRPPYQNPQCQWTVRVEPRGYLHDTA